MALERGPAKGSALFQQLMSARGPGKSAAARLIPEAEGLKGSPSVASLLKIPQQSAAHARIPGELPVSAIVSSAVPEREKLETARKPARPKTLSVHVPAGQVLGQLESQPRALGSGKEQKRDSPELSKAPLIEARTPVSRAEPVIRILDLRRTDKPRASSETADARKGEAPASSSKDPAAGMTLKPGAAREIFVETLPKPVPAAGTIGQTPLERLREMAGSELVRASNLVLKDGGGEIRLVLKPESLGSVRIRMNVVDNAIEGRIIVDSAAVKHVFDGNVDALRRALTAEGFQTGSLQVSVGGQNTDADERRRQEEAPAVRKIAVQGFERNVPGVENVSLGDLFVNLFV